MTARDAVKADNADGVTILLAQLRCGDRQSLARLFDLIYPELRKLAQRHFRLERPGHVLQPTALVNEAYLRLSAHRRHEWENRAHFFAAASHLMRRILVDHARARDAKKRLDVAPPPALESVRGDAEAAAVDLIALNDALDALARLSARQAYIVQLRYFGGLSVADIAKVLGVTARTVDRDWFAARAWLRLQLHP